MMASVFAVLLPTMLSAHETGVPHGHPHGMEWAIGLAALTVAAVLLFLRLRR
jgi:hypothetical protein